MIRTPTPSVVSAANGPGRQYLVKYVVRAIRAFRLGRARAADIGGKDRRAFLIKQDLAHLDRHQLRDIGLDRDAL